MSQRLVISAVVAVAVVMVAVASWHDARHATDVQRLARARRPVVQTTTRAALDATVAQMEARLRSQPSDGDAVVQLAAALVRVQRVRNDASAAIKAEQRLRDFLSASPGHYEAQRMLGTVLLSQHRFRDALRVAQKAQAIDPRDDWNYGVIGDAHLELGEYDEAFAAFDRMGQLRPGPAVYARVAYALELKGDLQGALELMRMAAEGTSAHDAEGQAWHFAQLGQIFLQLGRPTEAKREFEHARFTFPDHPYAMTGLARVKASEGDLAGALALYRRQFDMRPTPELAAAIGDLNAQLGRPDETERHYRMAEQLERDGWANEEPQPQALSRFLADRNRNIPEAVRLAEDAATRRRDIFTMDALAWAYFKAGRIAEARDAAAAALRTGTRDARIRSHAAAIVAARGDVARSDSHRTGP